MSDSALEGRTIETVRELTDDELAREGWDSGRGQPPAMALELDDGGLLYASADPEGNRPGTMFGVHPEGETFMLVPASNE